MAGTWQVLTYQSGTVVVVPDHPGPHYYVWHVPGDNEGQHQRYETAKSLEAWLNGGPEPSWLQGCIRLRTLGVVLPSGCCITAVGPSIDVSDPPGGLQWQEDPSELAVKARERLIDALIPA